jgi:hypothetical protein
LSTENKDFRVKNGLSVAGGGTFGAPVTVPTPVDASHAATKDYVDNISLIPGPEGPAGSYIASDTPPESPENNTAWFDTTTGATFMYYDGFWIETTGALGPTGPTGADGLDGSSGVISVTGPITNTGTATEAVIGLDETGLAHLTADQTFTGSQIVKPSTSSTTPLTVQGLNGQSEPLQTWMRDGDTYPRTQITAKGGIYSDITTNSGSPAYNELTLRHGTSMSDFYMDATYGISLYAEGEYSGNSNTTVRPEGINFTHEIPGYGPGLDIDFKATGIDSNKRINIYDQSDSVQLRVKGYSYQTANLQEWSNGYTNTILAAMSATGDLTAASIAKTGGTSGQFLKADGSVDSETYLVSNAPTITNPTVTINSSHNSIVTDYLLSYFISASGNERTMSFGSWTVNLTQTSLVAGDKILFMSKSGVPSTSEPVTVVSFSLNNSQVVVTSTNPAVLLELEAQNIVGGQAYKVIEKSITVTPQNLLRLKNLLDSPKVPENYLTLTTGRYFVPTSVDPYNLTLPASPELGDEIQIFDAGNYAGTNNITINRNGNKINGIADNAVLDTNGVAATFIWTGSTYGWRMG